jgi:hypothetical protein
VSTEHPDGIEKSLRCWSCNRNPATLRAVQVEALALSANSRVSGFTDAKDAAEPLRWIKLHQAGEIRASIVRICTVAQMPSRPAEGACHCLRPGSR